MDSDSDKGSEKENVVVQQGRSSGVQFTEADCLVLSDLFANFKTPVQMLSQYSLRIWCSTCCKETTRAFSRQKQRLDRFSRDGLRNRLHRQELKEAVKSPQQADGYLGTDSIPLRPMRDLWKALGFTVGVSSVSFGFACVADYERTRRYINSLHQHAQNSFVNFFKTMPALETPPPSPGEIAAVTLLAANLAVTVLWRFRSIHPFMCRYFTNSFASKSLCVPMLLSVFSHSSLIHFGLNMYVLYTFAHVAIDKFLGVDQFTAFYLSAGVASSLTSIAHKAVTRTPIRALGASGAILALLTYTCCKVPDARLKIVFFPWFDFSAESAVIGLVLFDLVGMIFRFRLFDHAAHLGGSAFGIAYALWGEQLIWKSWRATIQTKWKKMVDQ